MANLNKVMLIGRLTREPETRTTAGGTTVAKFGFAVNNKKKNQQTGQYEDDPVWLDVVAFGKTADLVTRYLHKNSEAYIEGHLQFEQWDDKTTGQKRSKVSVILDNVQFLGGGGGGQRQQRQQQQSNNDDSYSDPVGANSSGPDVPF